MGVPGPAIPRHNVYSVHVLGADPSFVQAAESLLNPFKVPVLSFTRADEEFRNSVLALVHLPDGKAQTGVATSWVRSSADRKGLLLVVTASSDPADFNEGIQVPDLWIVPATEREVSEATAEKWLASGAGAVAVFHPHAAGAEAFWISRNTAFGKSRGRRRYAFQPGTKSATPDFFAAGVIQACVEELLGENLFLKTSNAVDRECLEMRPLHLANAVEAGLAANRIFTKDEGMTLLLKKGAALDETRRQLLEWRGPEPKAWGNRGR